MAPLVRDTEIIESSDRNNNIKSKINLNLIFFNFRSLYNNIGSFIKIENAAIFTFPVVPLYWVDLGLISPIKKSLKKGSRTIKTSIPNMIIIVLIIILLCLESRSLKNIVMTKKETKYVKTSVKILNPSTLFSAIKRESEEIKKNKK